MRKKTILISFIILLIISLGMASTVKATEYDVGLEDGEQFIWRCNILDRSEMDSLLGDGWDTNKTSLFKNIKEGARCKWVIKETDDEIKEFNTDKQEYDEFLGITYKKWKWTESDNWGDEDYELQSKHYSDPGDYPDDYIFPDIAPIWIPIPSDGYMKGVDLYRGYKRDARARTCYTITCEIEENDLEGPYPTDYIKIHAGYNDKGILESYKLYLKDHNIILEIILENETNSIISMSETILPLIIGVLYLGLVYIMYKITKR